MTERFRVLILTGRADDDVALVRRELGPDTDIETIRTSDPAPPGPWDALLWDADLDVSATSVRDLVDRTGHPSLILLADAGGRETAERSRSVGSDDWVVRERPWRLCSAMRRAQRDRLDQNRRQMLHSQKMELLGQLAGGVAHDFNNILTVVSGSAELLRTRLPAVDPLRRHADEIIRAGRKAAALTRKLLTFGRKQDFRPSVVDVGALVADTEKMLMRLIGEDVTLSTHGATEPRLVRADAVQLEQVLMNLAVNARDAMPSGGRLEIRVERRRAVDEAARLGLRVGSFITLEVTDTGHGMDAITRARIFEPFFTTKASDGGTGLGLSTVYGIVRRCEGAIEVQSAPNAGTTFRVWLPETGEPSRRRTPRQAMAALPVGTGTVLLVEDESSVRRVLRHALRASGYSVIAAENGKEARKLLRRTRRGTIDVLVCDMVMPGISGPEFVRIIRGHSPNAKVVLISGYPKSRLTSAEVGDLFLDKPFAPERLAREIGKLLASRERSIDR